MGSPDKRKKRQQKKRAQEKRRREKKQTPSQQNKSKSFRAPASRPKLEVVRDLPGQVKMSEVLMEFIEPYEPMCAGSENAVRNLLALAVVAWNIPLSPEEEQEKLVQGIYESTPEDSREDLMQVLAELVARRIEHYSHIKRLIISYDWTPTPTGGHINVLSTLPIE